MGRPDSSSRVEVVIVALPANNEYIREVSSEKEPHLTLLYLGENDFDSDQLIHITEYVEHAASQLSSFNLTVERRGELGNKNADVLFFNKKWSKGVSTFRSQLLQDPIISTAYHSTDQFDEWTPHLTLGYPETPAKKGEREYSEFSYVWFDRIALWIGDSEGPTFTLKPYSYDMEVAMSEIKAPSSVVSDIIKHYGVKGMKWGVSRSTSSRSAPKPPATDDAKKAAESRAKAKAGGVKALTTKELQDLTQRMNLEQQYSSMVTKEPTRLDRGQAATKKGLSLAKTGQDVYNVINSPAGKALRRALVGV